MQKINPRQRVKYTPTVTEKNKKNTKKAVHAINKQPKNTVKHSNKRDTTQRINMTPSQDAAKKLNNPTKNERKAKTNYNTLGYNSAASKSFAKKGKDSSLKIVKHKPKKIGPNLSVVLGNKLKAQRKKMVYYLVSLAVVGSLIAFCASSPTGPIERITNSFAVIGGSSNPASLSGTGVKALKTANNRLFVVSDTHFDAFSASGKQFLSYQHNFSNPVLEVSHERTLVYNRESTGFVIANNSDKIFEQNLEYAIFCADIADCGSVAFATKASGYSAQVQVFARGMKQKFTWYLVDGLISDVALSDNGKYLAVSVLNVSGGVFTSVIYCFKTNSEIPLFTIERSGESVVSLETVSRNCFAYVSEDKISFINWKNGAITTADADNLSPSFLKTHSNGVLGVFSEAARSKIIGFNKKGIKKFEFEYNGLIDDIAFSKNKIYIMRSNQVFQLDIEGNELKTNSLNLKPHFITAVKDKVYCVDNLQITSY